jgi:hypothetical protein
VARLGRSGWDTPRTCVTFQRGVDPPRSDHESMVASCLITLCARARSYGFPYTSSSEPSARNCVIARAIKGATEITRSRGQSLSAIVTVSVTRISRTAAWFSLSRALARETADRTGADFYPRLPSDGDCQTRIGAACKNCEGIAQVDLRPGLSRFDSTPCAPALLWPSLWDR